MLMDSKGRVVEIDKGISGYSLVTTNSTDYEIHEGRYFSSHDFLDNIDKDEEIYWHLNTPDSDDKIHLMFDFHISTDGQDSGNGATGRIDLFEDSVITSNGLLIPSYNNNRNSDNASFLSAYRNSVVSDDGVSLYSVLCGSNDHVRCVNKFILKRATNYLFKFVSYNSGTLISACFDFYQIPPRIYDGI
jgi:hypothetical protein